MAPDLERCIQAQRSALEDMLAPVLTPLAAQCAAVWPDREALNRTLRDAIRNLPYCNFIYVTDTSAKQISDNIGGGIGPSDRGHPGLVAVVLSTRYPRKRRGCSRDRRIQRFPVSVLWTCETGYRLAVREAR